MVVDNLTMKIIVVLFEFAVVYPGWNFEHLSIAHISKQGHVSECHSHDR